MCRNTALAFLAAILMALLPDHGAAENAFSWSNPLGFEYTEAGQHISYIDGAACDTSLFADSDGKTYAIICIDPFGLDAGGALKSPAPTLGEQTVLLPSPSKSANR